MQFKNRDSYELALGTLRSYQHTARQRGRFGAEEIGRYLTPAELSHYNMIAHDCVSYEITGAVQA